jgi:hypothetical protein
VSKFIDSVNQILIRNKARFVRIAVSALGDVRTFHSVIVSPGMINRTSLICDVVVVHPFISIHWFTSMTPIVFLLARNNDLWRNIDVGPSCLPGDLDSIREC